MQGFLRAPRPIIDYSNEQLKQYKEELSAIASLSYLFSESNAPLIHYRASENIYCRCFGAKNVARTDCAVDAVLGDCGVGIKTFLKKSGFQKVAEFDRDRAGYTGLNDADIVKKVADLRNQRIQFAINNYGLRQIIYHCVVRDTDGFIGVFEESMDPINIAWIDLTQLSRSANSIKFKDNLHEYEFNLSKSTLLQRFDCNHCFITFKINILPDPIDFLTNALASYHLLQENPSIILPLYTKGRDGSPVVADKSGLNQWNGVRKSYTRDSLGRKIYVSSKTRDPDEAYIPLNKEQRIKCEDFFGPGQSFFPPRNEKWIMHLPDGSDIKMKVCQDNGKALMSDPNKDLGHWLLRIVLKRSYENKTPVTYSDLQNYGIDSVRIWKEGDHEYRIDFVNTTPICK